jgi:4-amino-4-deoxy-L-arabinose transferase-like glycosyltransferase
MKHSLLHYHPISIILFLASLLRFYQLPNQSLWSDEGNSVALARHGFIEIGRRTAFDIHPPLYYWLLKLWIVPFGDLEQGLRSLSVMLGIGLVFLIWLLGRRLFGSRVGLIAAFVAAFSPLQVYYSQEARMYILLAFLSTLTLLLTVLILDRSGPRRSWLARLAYILTVTAGLYTHYAYPVILIVANLVALISFYYDEAPRARLRSASLAWFTLQLIPLLLYLPWLPTAVRQMTSWPSERQTDSLAGPIEQMATTLLLGHSWPYNSLAVIGLGLVTLSSLWFGLRRYGPRFTNRGWLALGLVWLWLLLPAMLTLLIYSSAFLKFLLVATPPLTLVLAFVIWQLATVFERRWLGHLVGGATLAAVVILSGLSLYHYYTNSDFARDNYRGIVQFIRAVGEPEDAIILNAEGQQDVFNYYYDRGLAPETPVYPLPRRRPLDKAETLSELQRIVESADNVYAVYWASRQADPGGLVEGWLDSHLFKATDQWYGNVRLVSYATPQNGRGQTVIPVDYRLGAEIRLSGYTISAPHVVAGDILRLELKWEAIAPIDEDYTLFLQLLDQNRHVVGQRDTRPRLATSDWPVGETVSEAQGIFIEPGTPPGPHRLIVGLYHSQTGQRLSVAAAGDSGEVGPGDVVDLGQVEVVSPAEPLPLAAFDIQVPGRIQLNELVLFGYDLHKLGDRSSPAEALRSTDPIQLVLAW